MQQLPGSDAIFLSMETANIHAHTGGLTILDPSGATDFCFEKLKELIAERIQLATKFTWKLKEVPLGLDRPYWVEDPDFDVSYHMHRIAVPSPGGMRELTELCGDLFAHKLDRRRPLWEMWFIEGLENGRVATFMKTHHCLIDGVSGAGLSEIMCDLQADPPPRKKGPKKRRPRRIRIPGDVELALRSYGALMKTPYNLTRYAGQALRRGVTLLRYLREEGAMPMGADIPRLSFNDSIGPMRAFACSTVPLSDVKALKQSFGVKVNDVILELCGAAILRYLEAQGERPTQSLVVTCPISTRDADEKEFGNRVAQMTVSCATDIADPGERLLEIYKNTQKSKEMTQAIRAKQIQAMGETAPPAIINLAFRALTLAPPYGMPNATISNVPGPPMPLYMGGAKIETMYPMSVLVTGQGLNITVVSYMNRVEFGFTVDPDLIPDPWYIADGIPIALEQLKQASALAPETAVKRKRAAKQASGRPSGGNGRPSSAVPPPTPKGPGARA